MKIVVVSITLRSWVQVPPPQPNSKVAVSNRPVPIMKSSFLSLIGLTTVLVTPARLGDEKLFDSAIPVESEIQQSCKVEPCSEITAEVGKRTDRVLNFTQCRPHPDDSSRLIPDFNIDAGHAPGTQGGFGDVKDEFIDLSGVKTEAGSVVCSLVQRSTSDQLRRFLERIQCVEINGSPQIIEVLELGDMTRGRRIYRK